MTFRQPQTITRTSAGAYVNGLYVEGTQTSVTVMASVQPTTGEDMITLPQGRRMSDYVKIYTGTNLQVLGEGVGLQPDVLTWRGHQYECISVDVRQMSIIPHYKYIFSRIGQ